MNTVIQDAKEKAERLALAVSIAEHLHNKGFEISTADQEGVRVYLSTRKLAAEEVMIALTDEMRASTRVFEDWLRPEDTILVAIPTPRKER